MFIKKIVYFLVLFFCISNLIFGQQADASSTYNLIGTVVNGESNELLIGAHLVINGIKASKTDENGNFSLIVEANDTVKITYVGFKALHYIAPKELPGKYLTKFKLYTDSINLKEIEVFPWPSYEEFKKTITLMKPKEPEIKMEGIKMYQDRNIKPIEFPILSVFSCPISFIYDKLLDKQAKLRRRVERRINITKKAAQID